MLVEPLVALISLPVSSTNTSNISIGKLLFGIDFFILMLILIIFQDLRLVTYTLLFDFIIARVIDFIGEGGYAGKGFYDYYPIS